MDETLRQVLASLVAAVSLLERADEIHRAPRYAAPSDRMFKTMLDDYRRAIEAGRQALNQKDKSDE